MDHLKEMVWCSQKKLSLSVFAPYLIYYASNSPQQVFFVRGLDVLVARVIGGCDSFNDKGPATR